MGPDFKEHICLNKVLQLAENESMSCWKAFHVCHNMHWSTIKAALSSGLVQMCLASSCLSSAASYGHLTLFIFDDCSCSCDIPSFLLITLLKILALGCPPEWLRHKKQWRTWDFVGLLKRYLEKIREDQTDWDASYIGVNLAMLCGGPQSSEGTYFIWLLFWCSLLCMSLILVLVTETTAH